MGKFNLGNPVTKISDNIDRESLYLDVNSMQPMVEEMEKQFDEIRDSLFNINTLLNKAVARKMVKGKSADIFKGWARKCNSQAVSAENRKLSLLSKYNDDKKNCKIKQLEERIDALEKKLFSIKDSDNDDR